MRTRHEVQAPIPPHERINSTPPAEALASKLVPALTSTVTPSGKIFTVGIFSST
jgi:hypothetical protein